MTYTEYLNLKKPGLDDLIKVGDFNDNADILDTKIADMDAVVTAVRAILGAKTYSDWSNTFNNGQWDITNEVEADANSGIGMVISTAIGSGSYTNIGVLSYKEHYSTKYDLYRADFTLDRTFGEYTYGLGKQSAGSSARHIDKIYGGDPSNPTSEAQDAFKDTLLSYIMFKNPFTPLMPKNSDNTVYMQFGKLFTIKLASPPTASRDYWYQNTNVTLNGAQSSSFGTITSTSYEVGLVDFSNMEYKSSSGGSAGSTGISGWDGNDLTEGVARGSIIIQM